jgi:hypothetical protein
MCSLYCIVSFEVGGIMFQSDVLPSEGGGGTVFSRLFLFSACSISCQLREYVDGQSAVSSCRGHVLKEYEDNVQSAVNRRDTV